MPTETAPPQELRHDGETQPILPIDLTTIDVMSGQESSQDATYSPEKLKDLKIQIVDVSEGITAEARETAEAHISQQTTEGGFKGFLKRIWHGNLARDFILQRQQSKARSEIIESGNLYVNSGASSADYETATAFTVERVSEGFLHSGEVKKDLEDIEQGETLEAGIISLVTSYAKAEIDDECLEQEKIRLLSAFSRSVQQADRKKGLLLVDNVLLVARQARAAFRHGVAIDAIEEATSASYAEARVGVRTEIQQTASDRIVEKLAGTKTGSLVNETTIAAAVGIAMSVSKITAQKATTAAAATLSLGLAGGVIAGVREHHRIGRERELHLRERAQGDEMSGVSAKRREQLEDTRYESVPATTLELALTEGSELAENPGANPESLQDIISTIAYAQECIGLSDSRSIDLISYSGKLSIEKERLALDIALAKAVVILDKKLNELNEVERSAIGINEGDTLNDVLERNSDAIVGSIEQDLSDKDRVFQKLRRNQVAKMATIGAVTGLVIGATAQEIHAGLDDSMQGISESQSSSHDRQSLLKGLFNGDDSDLSDTEFDTYTPSKASELNLPDGFKLLDKEGSQSLIDANGEVVIANFQLDEKGHLDQATQQALADKGYMASEKVEQKQVEKLVKRTEKVKIPTTPGRYIDAHQDEFTNISRKLWYDNDTSGIYDHNELGIHYGGLDSTGLDKDGNFVFNVSGMDSDGSWHGNQSADAPQLVREGDMAIALSVTRDTQTQVIMIPIDKNGNAVIKSDSFAGENLFKTTEGKAQFVGAYAEAVQVGPETNGKTSVRMLATVVGKDQVRDIEDTVTKVYYDRVVENQEIVITTITPVEGIPVAPFMPVPLYGRRGLERLQSQDTSPWLPYIYAGSPYSQQEVGGRKQELSLPYARELEINPDAVIDANKTTDRYINGFSAKHRDVVRRLRKQLENQPSANRPKAVVIIPAAAHQEEKNIYHTLEQYLAQEDVSPDDFEVVVFANNPRDRSRDKTIQEVKRFQKAHPQLKVRLIEKLLDPDETNLGWVRKTATDTVLDDLRARGVDLSEVILVSNDADSEFIDHGYVRTIIDKTEANPDVDAFLGFIDWGYKAYSSHPDILVGTRLMQMIDTYFRMSRREVGSSGANFAFRPGIYSAVGGYSSINSAGEDVVLGKMIKSVRRGADSRTPIAFLGRNSEVNTSARRALNTLLRSGGSPASQWDTFGVNDGLRTAEFDLPDFDYNDEQAVLETTKSVERMFNQTLDIYRSSLERDGQPAYRQGRLPAYDTEVVRNLNRIFWMLGTKVKWMPDGSVKIQDATVMLAGLKSWQEKHKTK